MEATTQQPTPQRSLVRKLAEVMGIVERVPKRGRNDFHKYDYATEADIASAVRRAMAERHLMLVPDVVETTWHEIQRQKGGADRIATLKVKFTLMDGDSGEEQSFHVMGEGQDGGDKATYKAMTGAIKYALLKLFLIPTGDDPEIESTKPSAQGASNQRSQKPAVGINESGVEVVRFGRDKGKKLSDVDDSGLAWLEAKASEDVEKHDEKWHAKNLAWQASVKAEIERRMKPAASSQPPTAHAHVGGNPHYARLASEMERLKIDRKQWAGMLREMGVASASKVTEQNAATVIAAFSGPPDDVPPPGDADAPKGGSA